MWVESIPLALEIQLRYIEEDKKFAHMDAHRTSFYSIFKISILANLDANFYIKYSFSPKPTKHNLSIQDFFQSFKS